MYNIILLAYALLLIVHHDLVRVYIDCAPKLLHLRMLFSAPAHAFLFIILLVGYRLRFTFINQLYTFKHLRFERCF